MTRVIGRVLGPVVSLAHSLTIIASLGWSDLSVTCSSKLGTCFRWSATTFGVVVEHDLHFWWAHLAAFFQVVPLWVYSVHCSTNVLMTCFTSSDVSLAFSLSHWASLESLMPCLSGGHILGAQRCMKLWTLSWLNSALVKVLNHPDTANKCQNCCLKTAASSLGEIFSSTCINLHCVDLGCCQATTSQLVGEEFTLGIDPKSLHVTVLMQRVYNAVIWHSRIFLKHVAISVTEKVKITAV